MSKGEYRKAESKSRQDEIYRKADVDRQASVFDDDPLKQYIRRYGWLEIVREYHARMIQRDVNRGLKILTLPGRNASDVGLFFREGIAYANESQVLNVAICDEANALGVQANLVKLGRFLAVSNKELLRTLEKDTQFISQFPFDVINLDFCNQLFDFNNARNLMTLQKIFWLQKGQAFLLLLTSRSDPHLNIPEAESIISDNMSLESFRQAYIDRFGSDNVDLCMRDYVTLTQILFPKVVARLARDNGYRISEKFVAHYPRRNGGYHMVCHSFELTPLGRNKENLWYSPNNNRLRRNEIDALIYELPAPVRRQSEQEYENFVTNVLLRESNDIDRAVNEDANLQRTLTEEARQLYHWWESISLLPERINGIFG